MIGKLFSENFDRSFPSSHVAKTLAAVTVLVSSVLFCISANASCGQISPNSALASPQARSFAPMGATQAMSRSIGEDDQGNAVDVDDSIVGLWDVRFLLPTGELIDEGFDQFHSDGLEILNDNGAPQPANGAGTVCLGVFKKSGRGVYRLRHPFWIIDERGDLSGTGVFLETIILNDHRTFHGVFIAVSYDLSGHETSRVEGNLEAQRITVE
jgi:hypothetical protein